VASDAGAGRASAVTALPTRFAPVINFMSYNIVAFRPVTSSTASDTDAA
jgi:hypothetical protein